MTERIQRPRPQRTRPDRNPAEMLRAGSPGGRGNADPVSRSVGLGFQIVEQYLEQGRAFAAGAATGAPLPGANMMADLTSRMIRTTADLFEVWFQMMDVSGSARAMQNERNGTAPYAAAAAPQAAGAAPYAGGVSAAAPSPASAAPTGTGVPSVASTAVAVQVTSSRPATVLVDLRPVAAGAGLVAHALRNTDERIPRITDVAIAPSVDGGPVTVRIALAAELPPGVYNGMVIDEATSLPVGTISVRLEGEAASPA